VETIKRPTGAAYSCLVIGSSYGIGYTLALSVTWSTAAVAAADCGAM